MRPGLRLIAMAMLVTGGWAFSQHERGMEVTARWLAAGEAEASYRFPWREAGLTERQAAAHLVSRFTYGAKPGLVDVVVKEGLENWFAKQLGASLPDDSLVRRLSRYDALQLTNEEVANEYPRNGQVLRMAVRDGLISKDSVKTDRKEYRGVLQSYMQEKGFRRQQDLFRQFFCQKVLRAAYSENQLLEVMTDFWFNHFNVSFTKNDCADFIPAYERDVIRPNALGRFNELLLKTAKSPAMLYYLDNFISSVAVEGDSAKRGRGLNENYAREVMELHTLGVDGGYTQHDVTEAARVLTGWGVYPLGQFARGNGVGARLAQFTDEQIARRGFVHEGDFFFNSNRHDKGEKLVLGHVFPAGGGYEEGVELLNLLTRQRATAEIICRKIAVRFVSDFPPASLVDKMARRFLSRNGDIRQVLIAMVESPEFWSREALREKTKSPFELAIGAVRGLNGDVQEPMPLFNWVTKMGEKKYFYQAPTGFPDRGTYWINTGSLLNRMNFGLALAGGRVPGVKLDLLALNNGHEPESAVAALYVYGQILLPERDLAGTMKRVEPLLNDPGLAQRVGEAVGDIHDGDSPMLAQTVGIIIGSPEFQRR